MLPRQSELLQLLHLLQSPTLVPVDVLAHTGLKSDYTVDFLFSASYIMSDHGALLSRFNVAFVAVGLWMLYKFLERARSRTKATELRGPPPSSWLFGVTKQMFHGDSGLLLEKWATKYGNVYQIPGALGSQQTILLDTKAINHFFAKDTYGYTMDTFTKKAIAKLVRKTVSFSP